MNQKLLANQFASPSLAGGLISPFANYLFFIVIQSFVAYESLYNADLDVEMAW